MSIQLVVPGKGSLPARTPNLMPFDIKYTGTAPASVYFRPKPPPVQADFPTNVADGGQEGTSQLSTTRRHRSRGKCVNLMASLDAVVKEEPLVAAFRGRTIRGTRISVLDGYTGVVLIGADANKAKQPSSSLPSLDRQPSTRSGYVTHVDKDDEPQDIDMDDTGEGANAMTGRGGGGTQSYANFGFCVFSFHGLDPDIPGSRGSSVHRHYHAFS
ncbi:hypothetical protein BDM02DRAFT_3272267 [Thelephora ganbajun]|uniref:Uncharacterized protein n=1 Tax=Thelephora ganbajun TaxID=370292 RepID=A0ACB6Z547_THEGA|nr:hypothetical protein BDM02DRAFT_3272267 [Thelephora ganbajun]